ncbi:phospholipase D-like domain-containing protein [uncultured Desulfobacter sp.]|uniref:phospholipase D-like domain-containing protein n=1 Tax=uncultured Desulfobacter sp. TaxID=240139 RepID=UPI002AAAB91A|nr:phospholipase D-like domain-containing protein [uncultured Desulfobacter sp.]
MGEKTTARVIGEINEIRETEPFVLVATGSYIGEGFDKARLDTLFLAMPIAWKGTLHQYAGRLHRHFKNKKAMLGDLFSTIETDGVQMVYKSNIHQKFAIIDNRITWYGSINLLSFGYSEESIMRLESSSIACELAQSIR